MRSIISKIKKLSLSHCLINSGDKIAVGVSGGKDSIVLLNALSTLRKTYPMPFSIVAICVDLSNGKMDFSKIKDFCNKLNVEFELVPSNVFEVVFEIRKEKNPCSLCANLRRGILNRTAKKLGCTKVALGHHADDLLETFLMSINQEQRLYLLPPKSYLSRTDLTVIRPMLLCFENEIIQASSTLPIVKNICPADHTTTRQDAKRFLTALEKNNPKIKQNLLNALTSVERYNLWKNEK